MRANSERKKEEGEMWCIINKKTQKIRKVKIGYNRGWGGDSGHNNYAIGFSSRRALEEEAITMVRKDEEIKRINFTYSIGDSS